MAQAAVEFGRYQELAAGGGGMSSKPGLTQTLYALTTRVFRCRGLAQQSLEGDRFGGHDAAYWIVFCALAAAWFFFLFQPLRQRNEMLRGRKDVLEAQSRAEEIELRRLRNETAMLERKDPGAWERAARVKLGWLKPGEITDILAWRRQSIAAGKGDPAPLPLPPQPRARTAVPVPARTTAPLPPRTIPRIPPVPSAPPPPPVTVSNNRVQP